MLYRQPPHSLDWKHQRLLIARDRQNYAAFSGIPIWRLPKLRLPPSSSECVPHSWACRSAMEESFKGGVRARL
ncbi:hypothetical protein M409DRAFT_24824 [Zasmidium cellare ATCC 36951]|uniref:Uncharacterized protein n=1 Tax=Zasmidium cellare ATCC 36951 TaxID=1080233 RepID=A0A6A6CG60_ZASCE|nr:uncharacterized protein M409DRAFT_24824 [Zasmidium cellare ATCC 36951]KAF2164922.1 hypothetical protein M409DRAFT_24824 [Zasmidium cellare ATCC 36951]